MQIEIEEWMKDWRVLIEEETAELRLQRLTEPA